MDALLNPDTFDVSLLQNVVSVVLSNHSTPSDRSVANHVLTELKSQPFFFLRVPGIIESPVHEHVKVYAAQALEEGIKTRWKTMDSGTQVQIQQYIMQCIQNVSMVLHYSMVVPLQYTWDC